MIKALAVPYVTCLKAFPIFAVTGHPMSASLLQLSCHSLQLAIHTYVDLGEAADGATLDRKVTGWLARASPSTCAVDEFLLYSQVTLLRLVTTQFCYNCEVKHAEVRCTVRTHAVASGAPVRT